MILDKLEMVNFKCFRGKNTIEFGREDKNITVVYGENGRGKTCIYRAIMFCLYGERQLSQDAHTSKDELFLVNTNSVRESEDTSEPTEAYVELVFRHHGTKYTVRRSVYATFINNKQKEQEGDVRLFFQKESGDTTTYEDSKTIKEMIDDVLDSRVREFFLFDGERIETLTKASEEQRLAIGKAVKQLLNIDSLKSAISILFEKRKQLISLIQKNAKGEHKKLLIERSECEQKQSDNLSQIENCEEQISHALIRKEEYENKLKKFAGVQQKIQDKESCEDQVKDVIESLKSQRYLISSSLSDAASLLCIDALEDVFQCIDGKKKNKEIPSRIRKELIDELLKKRQCICGRPIDKDTPECEILHQWLKDIAQSQEMNDNAIELWGHLSHVVSNKSSIYHTSSTALTTYMNLRKKKSKLEDQIAKIQEEIGSDIREDVNSFAGLLKQCETDITNLTAKKINIEKENGELQAKIDDLNFKIEKEEKEQEKRGINETKEELLSKAKGILEQIQSEYIKEIRKKMATETTDNFRLFLDEKSKEKFSHVELDDKYSLQVYDLYDVPYLAIISAGERQLLSLAFITALAQTATNGRLYEMPLFMDTPFGRLSLEHRTNLIQNIPNMCAQWILLATDTELRREEAGDLQKTGRLGAFYRLVRLTNTESRIERIDTKDALKLLNS